MATYNNTQKPKFYSIAYGKIRIGKGDNLEEFTGIDGFLKDIVIRKATMNGEEKTMTEFRFVDEGEPFCISCELYGSYSNTILKSLANIQDFSQKILIETYLSKKENVDNPLTNISVTQNGEQVRWIEIPSVEKFTLDTGEIVKSTKKRDAFIDSVISDLQMRLKSGERSSQIHEGYKVNAGEPVPPVAPIDDDPDNGRFDGGGDYKPNLQ